MQADDDRSIFLSTLPATSRDRTTALAVVGVSSILFACAVPFAGVPLTPVPAFVASYQSALAVNDLITAILLFSQFSILRSRALLLLASGYLFTAAAAIAHALTFPGLFAPAGLLDAGPQTTVWLFMVWHGGFPVLVLGYALLKDKEGGDKIQSSTRGAILGSVAAVGVAILAVVWIVTGRHDFLPILLSEGHYTSTMIGVVSAVWSLSLAALLVLWFRRPHSVIDVWLMVVLCAWLFDIALSAIVNVARFDLGFYVGRIYGFCAASFVLAVLLVDNVALQAQMSRLLANFRRQAASDRDRYGERERLFSAVVASSNDAIITKTLDGTITGWNPAAERLFGFTAAEAIGRRIDIIVPADRLAEMHDILDRIGRGEKIEHHETMRRRKDGSLLEVSLGISPIRTPSGAIIGASKTARDISEGKRAREALLEGEQLARGIIDTALDAFVQIDENAVIVDWNPQAEAVFGWSRQDALGQNFGKLIVAETDRADLGAALKRFRQSGRDQILGRRREIGARRRDGKEFRAEMSVTALKRREGFLFNSFFRDLTDKIAAEDRIRQAEKMEAVGQLTGGIAHDFNNILTVITGTIEILADAVAEQPQLFAITKMIDEAATRGADLTQHLLAFARKQPLQPREIDVNTLIIDTAKLLRPTLGERIEIESAFEDEVCLATVDPNQLSTAILNLALNARDAMPDGGKLILETGSVYLDDMYASMHNDVKPGRYALIAVSDTGTGIPAALIDKVFDPFFTSKETGKGTGLGLSMVYGFVKQSAGHIKIYSEEGHGTTMKIYLPPGTGASLVSEVAAAPIIEGGQERILVVEDDRLVRDYVITQLNTLGYVTLAAGNAAEALAIVDTGAEFDLLFTDVIMPGEMNGRQLADEIRKRRVRLKALFTSGYTENAIIHHGRLDPGVLLLTKPYRRSDLAKMIRMALSV
jgi:PAS domain S-box-containing protein